MIELRLHDDRYIALKSDFSHKDTIKQLAPWPDVQWEPNKKVWLVDARLIDMVILLFADVLVPMQHEFVMGLPLHVSTGKQRKRGRPKKVKA